MKVKVYNLIILDESGSMEIIHKAAVNGLNETLQTIAAAQKKHAEYQEHFVTMVFFNSNGIRTVIENEPIANVKLLKMKDFEPSSCTPLYDAMGVSLSKLRYSIDSDEKHQVLVTIITDGEENASQEYTGKMIKQMVSELKKMEWVFAYIGANQDVDEVAEELAIENRMCFEASDAGSVKMCKMADKSRTRFYDRVTESLFNKKVNLKEDFFEE